MQRVKLAFRLLNFKSKTSFIQKILANGPKFNKVVPPRNNLSSAIVYQNALKVELFRPNIFQRVSGLISRGSKSSKSLTVAFGFAVLQLQQLKNSDYGSQAEEFFPKKILENLNLTELAENILNENSIINHNGLRGNEFGSILESEHEIQSLDLMSEIKVDLDEETKYLLDQNSVDKIFNEKCKTEMQNSIMDDSSCSTIEFEKILPSDFDMESFDLMSEIDDSLTKETKDFLERTICRSETSNDENIFRTEEPTSLMSNDSFYSMEFEKISTQKLNSFDLMNEREYDDTQKFRRENAVVKKFYDSSSANDEFDFCDPGLEFKPLPEDFWKMLDSVTGKFSDHFRRDKDFMEFVDSFLNSDPTAVTYNINEDPRMSEMTNPKEMDSFYEALNEFWYL